MDEYVTLHLFNPAHGQEEALPTRFAGAHLEAVRRLRGLVELQLFRCAPHQLTESLQPWRYAAFYTRRTADAAVDIPAIAPLLADLRDGGLIAPDRAERNYSYCMYGPWKFSRNFRPGPLTHIMFLLANCVPGHEAAYHRWYEEVHSVEVSEAQGYVGMRRGGLAAVQAPPVLHCPGDQLILGGLQTRADALAADLKDFADRAYGRSPSGIAWGDRPGAASLARTVHIFESAAGPFTA